MVGTSEGQVNERTMCTLRLQPRVHSLYIYISLSLSPRLSAIPFLRFRADAVPFSPNDVPRFYPFPFYTSLRCKFCFFFPFFPSLFFSSTVESGRATTKISILDQGSRASRRMTRGLRFKVDFTVLDWFLCLFLFFSFFRAYAYLFYLLSTLFSMAKAKLWRRKFESVFANLSEFVDSSGWPWRPRIDSNSWPFKSALLAINTKYWSRQIRNTQNCDDVGEHAISCYGIVI